MPKKIIFLFCLFLTGCSPEAKDKLLRAFFDGVPAKEEKRQEPVTVKKNEEIAVKKDFSEAGKGNKEAGLFFHTPFLENQCSSCHDTGYSQKLILQDNKLCFTCHDDFTKDKLIVHYPVKEGDCIDCHDPHQSANKFILKKPVPQICFDCHEEKAIRFNPVHEGQNICADCHNSHASNEEKLLK